MHPSRYDWYFKGETGNFCGSGTDYPKYGFDRQSDCRRLQCGPKGSVPLCTTPANLRQSDSVFTIAFGHDVYPFSGSIGVIDRAVDPQTGSIKTRLIFPNDKGMLKPGMNATVRVRNSASSGSTVIPYKAVTEQLGEFFVYVSETVIKYRSEKCNWVNR